MNTLDNFFYPKSIAIIGASTKPGSLSYELINNLLKFNYSGKIYPINPKADLILNLNVYKSVIDIEESVDLAIIMVQKNLVSMSIDECYKKNILSVILITAGFKETGEEGEKLENEILAKVRKYNMRLAGPNCMGIVNSKSEVRMNGTFVRGEPSFGGIGFCSQSGALGAAVIKIVQQCDIGLGQFISIGNKGDISENDIMKYWHKNDDVKVITMYLESFTDAKALTNISKQVVRDKPVLLLKAAKTSAGMRAASSHTGALASPDAVANALIRQAGILRVDTVEEMFDIAKGFDKSFLPEGNRVGILTNAGGPAILCVDECAKMELNVTKLSDNSIKKLKEFAHPEAAFLNPVDLLPSAPTDMWVKAAEIMMIDENIDSLIILIGPPLMYDTADMTVKISEAIKNSPKPFLVVLMSQDETIPQVQKLLPEHPPLYKYPETPAKVFGYMLRYKAIKECRYGKYFKYDVDKNLSNSKIAKYREYGETYLEFKDVYKILNGYGLPVVESGFAKDLDDIKVEAKKIGYPVVIKALGKELIHKSDAGGVKLNIKNEEELVSAYKEIIESLKSHNLYNTLEEILVQKYFVHQGVEIILGVFKDKIAGHVIMCGIGGIMVEIFKEVNFRIIPIDDYEAEAIVRELKGFEILKGIRGKKGINLDFVKESLLRLSQLISENPQIIEFDINPFIFSHTAAASKILDARIKVKF
jgi:acetyltransferase